MTDLPGILDGYLLAYPAKEYETGEEKIYFHDAVVDSKIRKTGVGAEMFLEVLEIIKNDEKLSAKPLVMRCREKTSYPLIKKYAKGIGFEIKKDDKFEIGEETMHYLELRKIE